MHTPELVIRLLTEEYGVTPGPITLLKGADLDWRGVYAARLPDGRSWVLRLIRQDEAEGSFAGTAALLGWLQHQGYPAPLPIPTSAGAPVGRYGDWRALVTGFVPGALLEPAPDTLRGLGALLGRLHRLPLPPAHIHPPDSWWPPGRVVPELLASLRASRPLWDQRLEPFHAALLAALARLDQARLSAALIHGDCWPPNAVRTPDGQTVLIDWDCAGLGYPLLDLANLLLAMHYDLSQPTQVTPSPAWVAAVLEGYTSQRPLAALERDLLLEAMRFCLAFAAHTYLRHQGRLAADDPLVHKLQARFAATAPLARLALGQPA